MNLVDLVFFGLVCLFEMKDTIKQPHYDSILLLLFTIFDSYATIAYTYSFIDFVISIVDFQNLVFEILAIKYLHFIDFPFMFFIINQ